MEKSLIENLSKIISKLPGLGPRVAKRIILNLANNIFQSVPAGWQPYLVSENFNEDSNNISPIMNY